MYGHEKTKKYICDWLFCLEGVILRTDYRSFAHRIYDHFCLRRVSGAISAQKCVDIYINLKNKLKDEDLIEHYKIFYRNEYFVRVLDKGRFASTHSVSGSNFCNIGIKVDSRVNRLVITSAIDNLIKGASGQAVQNMNIMLGFGETTGLQSPAIFP